MVFWVVSNNRFRPIYLRKNFWVKIKNERILVFPKYIIKPPV